MQPFGHTMIKILSTIVFIWVGLTFYVQIDGKVFQEEFGVPSVKDSVLIVFDPDPFYNLDQQVCRSMAKSLAREGWFAVVSSVSLAKSIQVPYDAYVICANTYNWEPDWAVTRFIYQSPFLKNRPVTAITLGAGSTGRAQSVLEDKLRAKEARLILSDSYWLLRPNDESMMEESNVEVAKNMATELGVRFSENYRQQLTSN